MRTFFLIKRRYRVRILRRRCNYLTKNLKKNTNPPKKTLMGAKFSYHNVYAKVIRDKFRNSIYYLQCYLFWFVNVEQIHFYEWVFYYNWMKMNTKRLIALWILIKCFVNSLLPFIIILHVRVMYKCGVLLSLTKLIWMLWHQLYTYIMKLVIQSQWSETWLLIDFIHWQLSVINKKQKQTDNNL